jgi:Tol biopolymer transport system component/DNA-binding winged helix-turn-helix (wHTH) protein
MTEPGRYEFGDVRVDLRRMIVSVRGEPVALEPKSFDVLRYLIQHRDRLVGKDDLLDAVWGDTFVTPNVLTRAVAQLRRAIGDDAHNARYIETVSRRGYRFLAEVTEGPSEDGATAEARPVAVPVPPPMTPGRGRNWPVPALLAAVVLALAAGAWWAVRRAPETSAPVRAFGLPVRVTTRSGLNTWPTLSPDGRSVAYVSDRSGSLEIYIAGLAPGGREIAITSGGMQSMQPDWSPDGQWIAFHSRVRRGVWVVPAIGGIPEQVVDFGSDPAWSPDGQWIAFTSDAGGMAAQSALWTARRDGTDLKQLTRMGQPPGGHREPAWSADGRSVLFSVSRGGWGQEIWTVPASGGPPRRLAAPRIGGLSPQFAPDGRALYWGSPSTGSTGGSLWRQALDPAGNAVGEASEVMDIGGTLEGLSIARDGSIAYGVTAADMNLWAVDVRPDGTPGEPVRLTQDVVRTSSPHYTADGRLAFAQFGPGRPISAGLMNDDGTGVEPLIAETWVANPQGVRDGRILVTRLQPPPATYWWVDPRTRRLARAGRVEGDMANARVSPDGRELAFHVIESTGEVNVWTRPLDGSGPRRRVTSDAEVMSYPAWSPDGRWLTVEIKRGDQTHVGVVPRDGGRVEQLTSEDGQSWPHSWSPDGERITFAAERGGVWNVWSVSRRTRQTTQLTHFKSPSGYVRYPAWSSRGNRIVFERSIRESSVWTVRPRTQAAAQ